MRSWFKIILTINQFMCYKCTGLRINIIFAHRVHFRKKIIKMINFELLEISNNCFKMLPKQCIRRMIS